MSKRSSQQSVSFSDELNIRSSKLVPLICYPRFLESEYNDRITEMDILGIRSLSLGGRTTINGLCVIGKGQVGIVLHAKIHNTSIALKIRRIDADRKSMDNEVHLHKLANNVDVGPHLEGHTKNLVAMELVNGQNIAEWVTTATKGAMKKLARSVLEQCYRLDQAGIDHGELSRLDRHVIISDKPYIIDFESASLTRKTSNVTAAAQSIFLHGTVARQVKKKLQVNREKTLLALKTYKRNQTRENFDSLMKLLRV